MGVTDGIVDEQAINEGLLMAVNVFLNRLQDEILAKKRLKVKLEVTVEEKDDLPGCR